MSVLFLTVPYETCAVLLLSFPFVPFWQCSATVLSSSYLLLEERGSP